jgi:hypothetical protein
MLLQTIQEYALAQEDLQEPHKILARSTPKE